MNILFFSSKPYDRASFEEVNQAFGHQLQFLEARLDRHTALLARGCESVCPFVNDRLDAATLAALAENGVRLVALRCGISSSRTSPTA